MYYTVGVAKSKPFSVRLSPRIASLIAEEAKRTRRSKGAVLERLADEALRCRRFPGIAFRGDDWDRRAWVIGTGLDVWQIIEAFRDFQSSDKFLAETDIEERQLEVALAYSREYPEEIDEAIAENRPPIDDLRGRHPSVAVLGLD